MKARFYTSVAVDGATLDDGETAILVDNNADNAVTCGTLTKTDGIYQLMEDDREKCAIIAISVQGTIIDIDVELADVPITTINADESESVFNVKPSAGVETFRVDATGNSPKIYGVDEIYLINIRGKVFPQKGQIIKPAVASDVITLSYGNGTYVFGDSGLTIGGLDDGETVDIEINSDGYINSVCNIPKDAYVTFDGLELYTAPFDNARLNFKEDPCYFEGYTLPEYNVLIDGAGNIKVDTGIQFGKVVESGKVLGGVGTIQIAGDGSAVKITNKSQATLIVIDSFIGGARAVHLDADDGVTFSEDGVSADDLQAVAGATIYLYDGQILTTREATVAAQEDATVGVNKDGTCISIDGSATIDASPSIHVRLGEDRYTVNGADFTTSGTAQALSRPPARGELIWA